MSGSWRSGVGSALCHPRPRCYRPRAGRVARRQGRATPLTYCWNIFLSLKNITVRAAGQAGRGSAVAVFSSARPMPEPDVLCAPRLDSWSHRLDAPASQRAWWHLGPGHRSSAAGRASRSSAAWLTTAPVTDRLRHCADRDSPSPVGELAARRDKWFSFVPRSRSPGMASRVQAMPVPRDRAVISCSFRWILRYRTC
jgi:hypothetical protein